MPVHVRRRGRRRLRRARPRRSRPPPLRESAGRRARPRNSADRAPRSWASRIVDEKPAPAPSRSCRDRRRSAMRRPGRPRELCCDADVECRRLCCARGRNRVAAEALRVAYRLERGDELLRRAGIGADQDRFAGATCRGDPFMSST
jgi:hypothetical protein